MKNRIKRCAANETESKETYYTAIKEEELISVNIIVLYLLIVVFFVCDIIIGVMVKEVLGNVGGLANFPFL